MVRSVAEATGLNYFWVIFKNKISHMPAVSGTIEKLYSIEEYLQMEEQAVGKHEFLDGKIKEMAGADPTHNIIAVLIMTELVIALRRKSKSYFVLKSDQKIHIPEFNQFVYPDAVVVADALDFYPGSNAIINPLLIVAILSPTTSSYDQTGKFLKYKSIPSFCEYLLVRQDKPWVMSSFRASKMVWEDSIASGLNEKIQLKSIDCELDLGKIYEGVKF